MTEATPSTSFLLDDGFAITAAEPWVKHKVTTAGQFLTSFVGNLAGKVNDIIFVDLYAGNGLYSLGARREVFAGHSITALSQSLPITKFILCEKDPEQSRVLKIRVHRHFRGRNIVLLDGKPESLIDKFRMYIPQNKGEYKVAVFCVCDSFSLEPPFDTMDQLNNLGFNFLMPFTFSLNERVNYGYYLDEGRDKVKRFLGGYRDIERLERAVESNVTFYRRLVRIYENNILAMGLNASNSVHKLDSGLMEMPVYYMGFFSKQYSTKAIQQDVEASRNVQFELFK